MDLAWMAWTTPTALLFVGIALALTAMTIWEKVRPTERRRGLLPMATTRGDRFFVGLLANAVGHLVWLGLVPAPVWVASILGIGLMAALLRWG